MVLQKISYKIYIVVAFSNTMVNKSKKIAISEQISDQKENKDEEFLEILKLFAPGTSLRGALDDLLNARMGALVVIENEKTSKIVEKGFRINAKFSSQKLVELTKMDGAIILSKDLKKILHANTLLYPSLNVLTKETGTRHKAAERTAKQTGTIVIAVSERKNKITIYYKDLKYELKESSEILRRAAETLQILEKHREIYNNLIIDLNFLEITNFATTNDICYVLQRIEIIKRISVIVKKYLIELGKEGMVVSTRLKELTGNLANEEEMILKDYFGSKYSMALEMLEKMGFDFMLEISNISRLLFEDLHNRRVYPRGERFLKKTNILERYMDSLINKFGNLKRILEGNKEDFLEIFENEEYFESFNKKLNHLKKRIIDRKDIGK